MIHETAIIQKGAQLEEGVRIGAYSIVEKNVRLGKNVCISPYVHIKGDTQIGENTFIGTGAVIGEMPQMLDLRDNCGKLRIGKNNTIREYVTINSSTSPQKVTSLGDNNYLMGFSHVAHDCSIANNVVICNGALIAGHAEVGDSAFISGNVVIHQFVKIGKLAMIGGLSRVNQDIPPFLMVVGDSRVWGLNLVGLRRASFSKKDIRDIRDAYNLIYRKGLPLKSALVKLEELKSDKVKEMIVFILASKRGICGPKRSTLIEKIFLDYPYLLRSKISTYSIFSKSRNLH